MMPMFSLGWIDHNAPLVSKGMAIWAQPSKVISIKITALRERDNMMTLQEREGGTTALTLFAIAQEFDL